MGSLVLELQEDVLDNSVPVLNLLRKALVVSTKLNIKEFQTWINLELNGYKDYPVPEYRKTRGQLRGLNPFHGWQPILTHDKRWSEIYDRVCECSIAQPISELNALVSNAENGLVIQLSQKIESLLIESVNAPVKIIVSSPSIQKIIESVKDIILNWALKLENDGILGEGITFSQKEKDIADKQNYDSPVHIYLIQSNQPNQSIFENIQGSTIVNHAKVEKSFDRVREQHSVEVADVLVQLADVVSNSGNKQAGELLDAFNDELAGNNPKKIVLESLWNSLIEKIPAISQINDVTQKVTSLFSRYSNPESYVRKY